jgi:hypothetical protein
MKNNRYRNTEDTPVTARQVRFVLLALVAGLLLSCSDKVTNEHFIPPRPTGLYTVGVTDSSATLRWADNSQNEWGFIVYQTQDSIWSAADTTGENQVQIVIQNLQFSTTYHFRVTAYNSDGESEPSSSILVQTADPNLPNAPTNIQAEALSSTIIRVTWTDRGTQDSFLIQRREPTTVWMQVGATVDNVQEYNDSTGQAETRYFYRVGAKTQVGISWSADSADVTTLPLGIPAKPESLQVQLLIGTGAILEWRDRSTDETSFEIGRAPSGQVLAVIATVGADTTTYTDHLGSNTGTFFYGVRAVNQFGHSQWTTSSTVDYRFCSSGVIPICINNFWQYAVDSVSGIDFTLQRTVIGVAYHEGTDYYLIGEGTSSHVTDTLYYMRNISGEGCYILPYPMGNATPELLFRYPPLPAGSHYTCQGDCVLSLGSSTIVVDGVTYTGAAGYERFFDAEHRTIYHIKPNTVGIIRELDTRGTTGDPVETCTRSISGYYVQN